jgi:hypothetical protein
MSTDDARFNQRNGRLGNPSASYLAVEVGRARQTQGVLYVALEMIWEDMHQVIRVM